MATCVNALCGASIAQIDRLWRVFVATANAELPCIVAAPTHDGPVVEQRTCVAVAESEAHGIVAVRLLDVAERGHVLALVTLNAASRVHLGNLAVANLPVAVSPPTVHIAVALDGARVELTGDNGEAVPFEGIVVPLPRDVGAHRCVASDEQTIDDRCQGPVDVEGQRRRGGPTGVVRVNRVGCVAGDVFGCPPDAAVGRAKRQSRGQTW